jgi:5-methylcytosine-specific restriction endonuclease McrA
MTEPMSFEEWGGRRPGRNARRRYKRKVVVWQKTGGYCHYCSCALHFIHDFDIDHVVPKVLGGSDKIENLVPACARCNRRKGGRPVSEFTGVEAI